MASPPLITPLPDPPARSQGPEAFKEKSDPFIAALPPMVTQENALAAWMNDTATAIVADRDAADASAVAAAESAEAAASVETDVSEQIALTATYANNAAASAASAEAVGPGRNTARLHAVALSFM